MTLQDYLEIARVLMDARDSHNAAICPNKGRGLLDEVTYKLADYMEVNNRDFPRKAFLSACGVS